MSRRTITGAAAAAAAVLLFTAGCKRSEDPEASASANGAANTVQTSGESMAITTTDGAIKLALANDTVYMGLTDSVLTAARTDMARDTEEKTSAIAGRIERFVKKSVSSALQMRLKYAVTDLDSATYNGGAIKFAYRNKKRMAFEDVGQNGHKALQSFAPADAQRFVDAVNSAIRARRGTF